MVNIFLPACERGVLKCPAACGAVKGGLPPVEAELFLAVRAQDVGEGGGRRRGPGAGLVADANAAADAASRQGVGRTHRAQLAGNGNQWCVHCSEMQILKYPQSYYH